MGKRVAANQGAKRARAALLNVLFQVKGDYRGAGPIKTRKSPLSVKVGGTIPSSAGRLVGQPVPIKGTKYFDS
jgi:hypothetical protein